MRKNVHVYSTFWQLARDAMQNKDLRVNNNNNSNIFIVSFSWGKSLHRHCNYLLCIIDLTYQVGQVRHPTI